MGGWFGAIGDNSSIRHLRIDCVREGDWQSLWRCVAQNSSIERLDVVSPPTELLRTESGRRVVTDAIRSNTVIKTVNVSGCPADEFQPYLVLNGFRPLIRAVSSPGDGSEGDTPLSRLVAILRRKRYLLGRHPICRYHLIRENVSLLAELRSRRDVQPSPTTTKKQRSS